MEGTRLDCWVYSAIYKNLGKMLKTYGIMADNITPTMIIVRCNSDSQCAVRSSISYLFYRYDLYSCFPNTLEDSQWRGQGWIVDYP